VNISGLIEGFYGPPWSEQERIEVGQWCADRGMTHYVYAPKDDPKHRHEWRTPYDAEELASLDRVVAGCGLRFGFAISPGLSMTYDDADDRGALLAKLIAVIERGVALVALLLDDIPPRPGLGEQHGDVTRWLQDELGDRAELLLVPTEYVGVRPSPYLDALAARVPEEVPIAWTGRLVVNDVITAEDARARAAALGGRPPLLWDNYPVNDAVMEDCLFIGPLRGRSADLVDELGGWIANPMVQPHASMLPLASVASLLRGEDAVTAWAAEAEAAGIKAFAEACDGEAPLRLAREVASAVEGAADAMASWIDAALASVPTEGPLAGEAAEWVEQLQTEADLCRAALRTLRQIARPDADPLRAFVAAHPIISGWPSARRGAKSVLGRRFGFVPGFGQGPDATWTYDRSSLTETQNATDILCHAALEALARFGEGHR
jgi:hypothetical protein